jgi:hypothetical protein
VTEILMLAGAALIVPALAMLAVLSSPVTVPRQPTWAEFVVSVLQVDLMPWQALYLDALEADRLAHAELSRTVAQNMFVHGDHLASRYALGVWRDPSNTVLDVGTGL